MVKIREIFDSIQGEGPFVGYKQLFLRFCWCNLHCNYCDTNFDPKNATNYTPEELLLICNKYKDIHSVSLTGGEPLLNTDFLKEFLPKVQKPVYLETNGTLYENLGEIINLVDYISADIKLPSCSKNLPMWEEHDKFFYIAKQKYFFAKAVFDNNITTEEICNITNLCKKYDIELILQPKMNGSKSSIEPKIILNVLNSCLEKYGRVRVIPQVHKYLNVE